MELSKTSVYIPISYFELGKADIGADWSNVVAAGSSALLPLLPRRDDVKIRSDPTVEASLETYYQ